ncbi:MAG: preprotein translocase subunit SecE [Methylococcales bacterium]|nr:preprotein translocase subunit SecE [Methylococcales bacterium]
MNAQAQAEDTSSIADVVKQGLSLIFVVAGVTAFYYFSDVPGFSMLYRVLMLVAIILISVGVMMTTARGKGLWAFALESKQEVRKVVWPTREETIRTTLLVFGLVFLVGLMLWILDMFLLMGIKSLTGQGG